MGSKRLAVQSVLFDLDGTLYNSREYSARIEKEIVGIVAEQMRIDAPLAEHRLREERRKQGTLTGALRVLGVDRGLFFEALAEKVEPAEYLTRDPSTNLTLETLKKRGFRMALVTNNGRVMTRKILNAIGLEQSLFDVTVTSDDCKPKPSSQPFLHALNKLNSSPEKAVYIGDRVEAELLPAQKVGIRTILLARDGGTRKDEVDLVIVRLQEILDLIEKT
jgi:putative hydrolase of the HAD superfamily